MIRQRGTRVGTFNTELTDRKLYFDGDSVVSPNRIIEMIDKGLTEVYVSEETNDIKRYNRITQKPIREKTTVRPLKFDWKLPKKYQDLDVVEYVIDKWAVECVNNDITSRDADTRAIRVSDELHLYKTLELFPILRAIIYIINTLQEKDIVWGVGRGSSVSSYVLYLIGVHDVDSVKYNLEITDFLRQPDTN